MWLLGVSWVLLLAAWLALHWFILPHIDDWRPALEREASQVLGVQVRMGEIRLRSSGWIPALELRDLRLLDAQGREALRLGHVATALSPKSLLALELRFAQLHLDGVQLDVRRDRAGHIHVAGLDMSVKSGRRETSAVDWLFEQEEIVIRHGAVRWTDELRQAAPLQLEQLDLVLRNGLRRHALRLDATPPSEWGERFTLRGRFTQPLLARAGDWRQWGGTLYAELPRADVAQLRKHVDLPFELSEGDGALRAWVELVQGLPRQLTVDMALRAVALRLTPKLEPLSFAEVTGRLDAKRDAKGVSMTATHFGFTTGDGLRWPASDMQMAWSQIQNLDGLDPTLHPVTGGEFSAERLDLDVMARTAARLPLGDAVRRLLAPLAPQGLVKGLKLSWDGPADAPLHYKVQTQLRGLSIAAQPAASAAIAGAQAGAARDAAAPPNVLPGRPGFRLADIDLQATEKGGQAKLSLADGALLLPGVMEDTELPLQRLAANLEWRITPATKGDVPPAVEVKVSDARFANADAQGELSAAWGTGPGLGWGKGGRYPGQLEVAAHLTQGRAERVAHYLPLGVPASAREYVRHAIQSGKVDKADIKIKGDLWEFPFMHSREGQFKVSARAQDVTLAYIPSSPGYESTWPVATKVSGEIEFDRLAMQLRGVQGKVLGFEFKDVSGGIKELSNHAVFTLDAVGRGAAADVLRYIDVSPVGGWLGGGLKPANAAGAAELKLALTVPLADPTHSTVRGSVALAGGDLKLRPDLPLLGAAKGRVEFTERSFNVAGGSAKVYGGDVALEGGSTPEGPWRFSAQGMATAEGLRRASEIPALAKAAKLMRGQAAYRFTLALNKGMADISVNSNLVGMALELPAPLNKVADSPMPLRFQTRALPAAPNGLPRDQLSLELGNLVQANYLREWAAEVPRVVSGGLALLDNLPAPPTGVHANLNVPSLNLDEWRAVAERLGWSAVPLVAGAAASNDAETAYLPQSVALRAAELSLGARHLSRVVASVSQQVTAADSVWRASVAADQVEGNLEYRQPKEPTTAGLAAGRFMARLQRLSLPPADAAAVEDLLEAAPQSVPALDIVVDDLELRGKKWGRVEVEAQNRGAATRSREWRLNKFNLTTPEARLVASGQWGGAGAAGAAKRMGLNFKLELADSGAFAERLGAGKALRGGKGHVQGHISWLGSPLSLDYKTLEGQMSVALEAGQFLSAEPGAARLLGVLSLQSLPRRLLLDFRDVFQEGFAFDNVTGDVQVAQGVASTRNLRMRGVQATVFLDGKADLQHEMQDIQVLVVPEVNAGAASLAYAAVNPVIGLTTFVAQLMFRKPLMLAGTREFHVSGSWTEPKVERIERHPDAPLPVDAPTSAAPAASSPLVFEPAPPASSASGEPSK